MELTIDFLKQMAIRVYDVVSPLLGTEEAKIGSRKGAGGDISMNIDIAAENAIIEMLEANNADLLLISEEIGEKLIGDKEKAKKNRILIIGAFSSTSIKAIVDIGFYHSVMMFVYG